MIGRKKKRKERRKVKEEQDDIRLLLTFAKTELGSLDCVNYRLC